MSDESVLVDGQALAQALGVDPALIRKWASRGKLRRHGQDAKGRTLYDLAEGYRVQANVQRYCRSRACPTCPTRHNAGHARNRRA